MLILVLSVIASPEGKVYLELSSNVKNEEKVNKETVTLGLISILVEVSKKKPELDLCVPTTCKTVQLVSLEDLCGFDILAFLPETEFRM